ncbi:MAG: hypothetical protein E7290_02285 [Lachnospiraceae bacterium]|nr:hypothetical protein [Lachnospiraceae bacterium]
MRKSIKRMSKKLMVMILSVTMAMSNVTVFAAEAETATVVETEATAETETVNETATAVETEAVNETATAVETETANETATAVETETVNETTTVAETETVTETVTVVETESVTETATVVETESVIETETIVEIPELMVAEAEAVAETETVADEETVIVTSTSNAAVWSAEAMLTATSEAVNGLQLMGEGWSLGGPDSAGGDTFGTDGTYAKAGGTKAQTDGSNAKGTIPNGGCYLQYTAQDDGTFIISEKTQKSNKTFYVVDSNGTVVTTAVSGSASTYDDVKVPVTKGVTYYAYMAGSTANIFKAEFVPTQTIRTWSAEALFNANATEDNGLKLCGEGWSIGGPDSAGGDTFGTDGTYAKAGGTKAQTDGSNAKGSIPNGGCYLEYTASANGKLVISEKTQKSNKTFYVVNSDGEVVKTAVSGSASTYDDVTVDVVEGKSYYAYMAGSTANIFQVKLIQGEKEVTPWEEVAAPIINKVTMDADGNLEVDYSAVIDEYKGAQQVTVIMFYEGHEAGSVTVTKPGMAVEFAPLWSGNYTFVAIAQRAGVADKSSEVYAYDGYVLPVKKPIVELAQNRGNGVVYLDWINALYADYFNVYYKESGAAEYTTFETEDTDGYATIEGLTVGAFYDFKLEAVRKADGFVATYEYPNFVVTQDAQHEWFFGTVGSAQETHAIVADAAGNTLQKVDMSTKDEAANKQGIAPVTVDVVNTANTVAFAPTGNGKISDGEEGFQYFYTMIDPNTENFKLTATFTLTSLYGNTFDNQTGYGIIATDMLGYNYYGTDGLWIKCKQLNSVSTQIFSVKANFVGQRNISGYESVDTTATEGYTRITEQQKFQNTKPNYEVGTTYTFTLEKTNDGYYSSCNGETVKYEDLSILSKQEDGSLCIGVFASRNAGITVSDIQFETSESTGITSVEKSEAITPNAAILSSNNVGTDVYEYIYVPNIAGDLTVSVNGTACFEGAVEANKVVRVNVPVKLGANEVVSSLVPDASQNLTKYDTMTKSTKVEYQVLANSSAVVYVAADGTAAGKGTSESPVDLATAVKYAAPGQYIVLKNGTYTCNNITIGRSVSGTADKPIYMVAEDVNGVVFKNFGLTIVGSYWHVYGIYVQDPSAVGIQVSGNYNTIEMCTVEGSGNTGIQISRSGSVDRDPGYEALLWPSYNLIKNCESFDNCDAGRNDADGFAAKLTCGEGNVFYGCIGHNNIDDGWDLFAKAISGEIGAVTIENCIAYNNGWLTDEDTTVAGYEYGEGNGFKLGGNDMYGGHILKNSIAFGNIGKGITSNSCPDCKVFNSTSYGNAIGENGAYNISFATKASNLQKWEVEGLISVTSKDNTTFADQIPKSFLTENNYLYDGALSYNNKAVTVSDDWFENVDLSIIPTRNADGTINMQGLLNPTELCPVNAGGRLDVTSDEAKSVKPQMPTVEETPEDEPSTEEPETDAPSIGGNEGTTENKKPSTSKSPSTATVETTVTIVEQSTPLVANPSFGGVMTAEIKLSAEGKLKADVLAKYYGQYAIVMVHAGNGIGYTIDTLQLTGSEADLTLKNKIEKDDNFAEGFETYKITVVEEKQLTYEIGTHINVGAENAGKTAYIFALNLITGQYEVKNVMTVNEIGNVVVMTNAISDMVVLVQE